MFLINTGLLISIRMQRRDVLPVEQDTSGIRLVYTGQQIEYRRFTGSVRSDQSVQLAFLNCNIKSVYRAESAKGNAQIFLLPNIAILFRLLCSS